MKRFKFSNLQPGLNMRRCVELVIIAVVSAMGAGACGGDSVTGTDTYLEVSGTYRGSYAGVSAEGARLDVSFTLTLLQSDTQLKHGTLHDVLKGNITVDGTVSHGATIAPVRRVDSVEGSIGRGTAPGIGLTGKNYQCFEGSLVTGIGDGGPHVVNGLVPVVGPEFVGRYDSINRVITMNDPLQAPSSLGKIFVFDASCKSLLTFDGPVVLHLEQ